MAKWFKPKRHTGWRKDLPMEVRRARVRAATHDYLSAGRAMQSLANVTKDRETHEKALADARYFFAMHSRTGR